MVFWWVMMLCCMICPVIMIAGGWAMWKRTPEKINSNYGYRTKRSGKSIEAWTFANKDCGKRWWLWGWITLPAAAALMVPFYGKGETAVGISSSVIMVLECIVILATIIPTERALKNEFDEEGKRKHPQ